MNGSRSNGVSLGVTQMILGVLILLLVIVVMTSPEGAWIRSPALAVVGVLAVAVMLTGFAGVWTARRKAAEVVEEKKAPVAPPPKSAAPEGVERFQALVLLSLLQEKGRLIDFVMEDITTYSDQQVSAAARVVHQGCREVVTNSFDPAPVSEEAEKKSISLPRGYSAEEFRIVGTVGGEP
ncbi:MAG: DUF2760 domain-containing protein, partial [Chitinivibrionales bacterium]|nr:DUF2760 domain-containing protein [Chitinivibrionales bacterium]MBD3357228.1 DUF2760 domain-containing protein [Chitinivibrionales bacterium]